MDVAGDDVLDERRESSLFLGILGALLFFFGALLLFLGALLLSLGTLLLSLGSLLLSLGSLSFLLSISLCVFGALLRLSQEFLELVYTFRVRHHNPTKYAHDGERDR